MKHILVAIAVFGAVTLFVVWGGANRHKVLDVSTETAPVQKIEPAEADEPKLKNEEPAELIGLEPVIEETVEAAEVEAVTILGKQEEHTSNIEPNAVEAPTYDPPAESEPPSYTPPAYTPPAYTPPVVTAPPNLVHEGELNEVIDYGVYCGTCGSLWDTEHNTCPVCFPYTS